MSIYYLLLPIGYLRHLYHPTMNTHYKTDEEYSLSERFLKYNTITTQRASRLGRIQSRILSDKLGFLEPWSMDQVVDHYTGSLRRKYKQAKENIETQGYNLHYISKVTCFVKTEKWKEPKPPRTIMFRHAEYCLLLSTYTKAIEERLYSMKDHKRTRIFAKGLNQTQRYNVIKQKFDSFVNTHVVGIDCTKFDAHVTQEQLRIEGLVYKRCFRNCPELKRLLDKQLVNRILTMHGRKLISKGKRMTGDANTGLGNCIIVYIMIMTWIRTYNLHTKVSIFCDGDDTLLFFEEEYRPFVTFLMQTFSDFGHTMRIDKETNIFNNIMFCQCYPVGGTMVRPFQKVLSHAFVSHKHYNSPKHGANIAKTIAQGELALNSNIPIMGPFFSKVLTLLESAKLVPQHLDYRFTSLLQNNWKVSKLQPITKQTREEFFTAFNITPVEQKQLEIYYCRILDICSLNSFRATGDFTTISTHILNTF
jgi:hypothetical protein